MAYATEAELTAYATARGVTITGTKSVLLTKAHDFIDSLSYPGWRTEQGQEDAWPREDTGLYHDDGYAIESDEIPYKIKQAEMMAALIYDAGGDPQGAIDRTVKREKVDVIEVEYADNAAPVVLYPALTKLLAPYLKAGSSGSSFVVSRG